MKFTLIVTGLKCDLCSHVWIQSFRGEMPKTVQCPNCKQIVEYEPFSLDKIKTNEARRPGK